MPIEPGLRRLALRTILAAFAGKSAPDWALRLLSEGLAGHTLFGTNIAEPVQLAGLTATLRAERPDVLIAIDEEGGDVTRLGALTGSPYPGNAALGAVDDAELTRAVYAAIGADLSAAGINVNLAPTVDVNSTPDNPIIGTRSFGADPLLVARHAVAAVTGLQSAGIAACAKHFPGHGATVTDSHLGLPTIDVPADVLQARDLPPFAAVTAQAKAVMSAHIRVPHLTGDDPATFSRAVMTGLLRGELGFRGVVITDGLEMAGAARTAGGVGPAAVRALAAGADLLCIGADVDEDLVEAVVAEIVRAVTGSRLAVDRLEEAADRVSGLAAWISAQPAPSRRDLDLGYAAARRAVRVEGSLVEFGGPLIVQLESGHSIAEGRVPWGLEPHMNGVAEQVTVAAAEASAESLAAHAGARPIVVVGRNTYRTEASRDLIERLSTGHTVAVVEMGWPSSWRPAGARAFVTTYGASHANGRAAAEALGLTAL